MFWRLCLFVLIATFVTASDVGAQLNRGLFMTPVREYLSVSAGSSKQGRFTLANLTEREARITISVEQFTVEDYTYDYRFTPSKRGWVRVSETEILLESGKSREVPYQVTVPKDASPGGYYFTIFATNALDTGRKVRVGEALYLTVEGDLKLTSSIQNDSLLLLSLGGDVAFSFDIKSTANSHFFAYMSGTLAGMGSETKSEEMTQLILPDTVRTIKGTIPSPVLPGVYQATYGYRVDDGQSITKTRYIVFAPLWFLAFVAGGMLLGIMIWKRRRRLRITGS